MPDAVQAHMSIPDFEANVSISGIVDRRPYGPDHGEAAHEVTITVDEMGHVRVSVALIRTRNDDGSGCLDRGYGDPGFTYDPQVYELDTGGPTIRAFARTILAAVGDE